MNFEGSYEEIEQLRTLYAEEAIKTLLTYSNVHENDSNFNGDDSSPTFYIQRIPHGSAVKADFVEQRIRIWEREDGYIEHIGIG